MPGWKFVIGGGEKIKNQETRNYQNNARNESSGSGGASNSNGGSGGGQQGGTQSNAGSYGMNAAMSQAYFPPAPSNMRHPQMMMLADGGNQGASAYNAGYYDGSMAGGMMSPQNSQMGYIWDDPEEMRRRGPRTRAEGDESMEIEARRGRSRRTGRFVHRAEGDEEEIMAHAGRRREEEEDREDRSGSYRRQDHEDNGEVERLHKKIKKLEQRLEEGEEAQEHVRHLKKEVKRLKEALEEIKEERGKEGGEDREKRDKKKKERGKDEEEDDEDDPLAGLRKLLKEGVSGKEFLKHLPRIFHEAFGVIANPPQTWPPYLEKGDFSGIYTMEAKELMKAIEQYKAGQKGVDAVMKEIKHTGAALIQMYANLLQQMEEKK